MGIMCRYDREEGSTMFDADSSSFFYGDEKSFKKKETELTKKLVCVNTFCLFMVLDSALISHMTDERQFGLKVSLCNSLIWGIFVEM